MSALYFHIPFCKRLCAYCDFHRFADLSAVEITVEAMHREIEETAGFLHNRSIATIYFGGGTPSLLAPSELQRLIDSARRVYDTSCTGEITVEVNPDDVTRQFVDNLLETDINRISIGIQSFDDRLLKLMNRRHDSQQAEKAVRLLQDAGYANITADLIFGVDGFGPEVAAGDIERLTALDIQHVSAYHLTIEPDTKFGRMAVRGELRAIDEELSEELYRLVHDRLTAAGFEHYEVSNYAREGFRASHNSSYWLGDEYIGIGPGAHSFNGEVRRWCDESPREYAVRRVYESETLTEKDRFNEMIMTSLRRTEGIDAAEAARRFGAGRAERLLRESQSLAGYGVVVEDGRIRIPPERMLTSDAAIAALFEE